MKGPKTLNVSVTMSERQLQRITEQQGGYSRWCWETYGRYVGEGTKAQIRINITEPQ